MLIHWMECDSLRHTLGLGVCGYDSWCNVNTIVRHRRNQAYELQWSNADLLPHRDRCDRDLRPAAHGLGQPARLTRELDPGLLAETEGANISVEAIFTQTQ